MSDNLWTLILGLQYRYTGIYDAHTISYIVLSSMRLDRWANLIEREIDIEENSYECTIARNFLQSSNSPRNGKIKALPSLDVEPSWSSTFHVICNCCLFREVFECLSSDESAAETFSTNKNSPSEWKDINIVSSFLLLSAEVA